MDKMKLRPLLYGIPFVILAFLSLSFFNQKAVLKKTNAELLERSKVLQAKIEETQRSTADLGQQTKETLAALKRDNQSLHLALKKNAARLESLHEEKSYLEEMLINKTKQIELSAPVPGDRDEEMKRLIEQNRILQDKLDRLYKTTSAKINEINIAKIALEETVSTAKKKIDDEWNTVNLGSVSAGTEAVPPAHEARSEGKVLAINPEHGFVVVDLGKADNLPSDATLEVTKNGEHVATLSVLEIRDVMAACNIKDLRDGQTIEINDPVSILR